MGLRRSSIEGGAPPGLRRGSIGGGPPSGLRRGSVEGGAALGLRRGSIEGGAGLGMRRSDAEGGGVAARAPGNRRGSIEGGAALGMRRSSITTGQKGFGVIDPLTINEREAQKIASMNNSKLGETTARMRVMWGKLRSASEAVSLPDSQEEKVAMSAIEKKPRDEAHDKKELRKAFGEKERKVHTEHATALAMLRVALEAPPEYAKNGMVDAAKERHEEAKNNEIADAETAKAPAGSPEKTGADDPKGSDGSPSARTQQRRGSSTMDKRPSISAKRDLTKVIELVNHCAPLLLGDLAAAAQRAVARELSLREFERGSTVFKQGDLPDGYYFILSGEVTIYKHLGGIDDADFSSREGTFHELHGKKLVSLHREQGFGELSFARIGQAVRSATVVADGDEEMRFMDSILRDTPGGYLSSTTTPKIHPTLCLHVPAHTYVLQMSQKTDDDLRRKMGMLENSLLFQHRPLEKLYEIAQHLRPKNLMAGKALAHSGQPTDEVFLLMSGEIVVFKTSQLIPSAAGNKDDQENSTVIVSSAFKANARAAKAMSDRRLATPSRRTPDGNKSSDINGGIQATAANDGVSGADGALSDENSGHLQSTSGAVRRTEIALLGQGEIFGIVDVMNNKPRMTRSAICTSAVEVLMLSSFMFKSLVLSDERSAELVNRLVRNRVRWEELRVACTQAHPELSTRITHETMHLAKYVVCGYDASRSVRPSFVCPSLTLYLKNSNCRYTLSPRALMPRQELRRLEQARSDLGRSVRGSRCAHQRALAEERRGRTREALASLADAEAKCHRVAELAHQLSAVLGAAQMRSAAVQADEAQQRLDTVKKLRVMIETRLENTRSPLRNTVDTRQHEARGSPGNVKDAKMFSFTPRRPSMKLPEKRTKAESSSTSNPKNFKTKNEAFSLTPRRPSMKLPEKKVPGQADTDDVRPATKVSKDTTKAPAPGSSRWRQDMRRRVQKVLEMTNIESIPQGLDLGLEGGPSATLPEEEIGSSVGGSSSRLISTPGRSRRGAVSGSNSPTPLGENCSLGTATFVETPLMTAARRLELSLRGIDPYDWAKRNDQMVRQQVLPSDALSAKQQQPKTQLFNIPSNNRPGAESPEGEHGHGDSPSPSPSPSPPGSRPSTAPGMLPPTSSGSRASISGGGRTTVSMASSTKTRVSASISQAVVDVREMRKLLVVDDSPMLRKLLQSNFSR